MSASQTNQLVELSGQGESRFSVELTNAPILLCEKIVRRVPDKRIVAKGVWRGKAVFAKLFLGKNALKYLTRDKHGIDLLTQANIATPEVLYTGLSSDGNAHVLILNAIEASQSAEVAWQSLKSDDERLQLAKQLVAEVAKHHQAGLLQTDLYFKNFLIQANKVFTLDGDGIRHLSFMFKARQKHRNLATLFSKMDVLNDAWLPELYRLYCETLGERHDVMDESAVWLHTQEIRHAVASGYADKKVFRNCTDVKVHRDFYWFIATARDFLADEMTLKNLDGFLQNPTENLKNGNTCTIAKASLVEQNLVIKRYNIKGLWHGFSRALRQSRAAASWANAHRLQLLNIATPKPLALVEERLGFLRKRAYFLSEFVNAPDALQFFAQCQDADKKQRVASNIATLFYRLYLLHISHGDMKATNIKIVDEQPLLIDLDSLQAHGFGWFNAFERNHIRDLKRLLKNWQNDAQTSQLMQDALLRVYDDDWDPWHIGVLERAGIKPP